MLPSVARKEPSCSLLGFNIYALRVEATELSETLLSTTTHGAHIPQDKSAGSHCYEDVIYQRHDAAGNYLWEIRPSFRWKLKFFPVQNTDEDYLLVIRI